MATASARRLIARMGLASAAAAAVSMQTFALAQDAGSSAQQSPTAAGEQLAQAAPQDTTSGEKPGGVEEIVVTAQYRRQALQSTPLAITAITPEQIEQRSATSLAQIAATAPSVVLRTPSAAFGNSIIANIRGFGQIDFDPAYEPGVGLYVDDVYYPRLTGADFDLLDLERIEVLRGPQGTLEGRNSEGGAIRLISRPPKGDDTGYVSATYGSRNRIDARAASDFKLTDYLFMRVSGAFKQQDGYVHVIDYGCSHPASGVPQYVGGTNCDLYSIGDVGFKGARAALRFRPSDELDLIVTGEYIQDKHYNGADVLVYANNPNPNVRTVNGLPFDSRFICGPYCNYATTGQEAGPFTAGAIPPLQGFPMAATAGSSINNLQGPALAANLDYNLTDAIQLKSISSWRHWQQDFSIDGDLSPARVQFGNNTLTDSFWSEELRLNAELSKQVLLTVGLYDSIEKSRYYTLQDIRYVAIPTPGGPLPLFPLQFIGNDPIDTNSKAAYTTGIFKPIEALTVTAGLRYTHDTKDYTFYRYNLDGRTINAFLDPVGAQFGLGYQNGSVAALSGRTASFSGNRVDYRLTTDYRFNPIVMAYATVSTGYKAGGVGPRPFNASQARSFGPERLTNFEIGSKTDLLNRRLRLNGAVFYDIFKDAQLTLLSCPQFGGPGPCALPQNAGDAHNKGIELEAVAEPIQGLQLDAAVSRLFWEWTCVNPQVVGLGAGPCSSNSAVLNLISSVPRGFVKSQWNVGLQYEAPLGASGSLTTRLDVVNTGEIEGEDLRPAVGSPSAVYGVQPGYTLTNARLTWRNAKKNVDVAMEVTNLFDRYYFVSKFDLTGAGAGAITGQPGHPREWAITVKKTF